jgi:transmembrane sensor
MTNILNFPGSSRSQEEAGYWLARLDDGPLSDEEAKVFHDWLNADGKHRDALIELAGLWDDMDMLSELSDLFPLAPKTGPESGRAARFLTSPALAVFAAAAVVLAVALIVLQQPVLIFGHDKTAVRKEVVYRTAVGEQKDVSLPDGSNMKLNTDSLVSVGFTSRQRNLHLLKGEAMFKVAHDRSRPFIVHAGSGVVRAVGTAFSVHLKGPDVEVTVTEGRVEIASAVDDDGSVDLGKDDFGKYLTTLDAGQTAEYGQHTIHSVRTIAPELITRKMSWQHGTLVFKGETLEEVVREISRYTDTRLVISDPAIRNIRIGGYFKTGEVDALLTVLKDNFSIKADKVNDNLIYLTEDKVIQAQKD